MGYFDSAKNRAAWEKKMTGLRAERRRREAEGFKPMADQENKAQKEVLKPGVTRVTFRELEAEEAAARQKSTVKEGPSRETLDLGKNKEKDASQQLKPRERSM